MRGPTPQLLDPLSAISARLLVNLAAALSVAVAAGLTIVSAQEIVRPWASAVALASLAGAIVVGTLSASPFRAPFRGWSHLVILLFLIAAMWFEAASTFGANTRILDDWGTYVAAILIFPLGYFRPWRELLLSAAILTVMAAVVPLVHSSTLVLAIPPAVFSIVSAAPVLGAGLAGAAFSASVALSLLSWRVSARRAVAGAESAEIAAEVADERLQLLNREILPLLALVASEGTLTARDSDRARMLASTLRATLVDETERSWIEDLGVRVRHGVREADAWEPQQRAALRALLERILDHDPALPVELTIDTQDGESHVGVHAVYHSGAGPTRGSLAPYIATLRVAFERVSSHVTSSTIDLTFTVAPPRPTRQSATRTSR